MAPDQRESSGAGKAGVEQDDGQDGERPQAVDVRPVEALGRVMA